MIEKVTSGSRWRGLETGLGDDIAGLDAIVGDGYGLRFVGKQHCASPRPYRRKQPIQGRMIRQKDLLRLSTKKLAELLAKQISTRRTTSRNRGPHVICLRSRKLSLHSSMIDFRKFG